LSSKKRKEKIMAKVIETLDDAIKKLEASSINLRIIRNALDMEENKSTEIPTGKEIKFETTAELFLNGEHYDILKWVESMRERNEYNDLKIVIVAYLPIDRK
jgi:hypothetical protein